MIIIIYIKMSQIPMHHGLLVAFPKKLAAIVIAASFFGNATANVEFQC